MIKILRLEQARKDLDLVIYKMDNDKRYEEARKKLVSAAMLIEEVMETVQRKET